QIALQTGVYTEYTIFLYHLKTSKSKITLSGKERWITLKEIIQGETHDGINIISPFRDIKDKALLENIFNELSSSFSNKLTLPKSHKDITEDKSDSKIRFMKLLKEEESSHLEFKSSLRWDYRLNKINKDLEKIAMKTIVGFLNSGKGTLLIGVDDNKEVVGTAKDITS